MAVDVTLGANRLIITDTVKKSSITYTNIVGLKPLDPATYDYSGATPSILAHHWYVIVYLADKKEERIPLGSLASQPTWTNNAAGYSNAEAAIYAAFPSGGGGSGTVTDFSFTNTTYATGSVATSTTTPTLTLAAVNATRQSISQAAHGLAVGDVVRRSSGSYVKAQANSATNAEVVGIVTAVADASTFTLTTEGLAFVSGLTDATTYFLSPTTAGLLTTTEPTAVGQVSKPVLIANSTVSGFMVNMRGMLITAPPDAIPVYRATLAQTSTTAPTATGEYNTTGLTPTYVYSGVGDYAISMPGLPNGGRVKVFIGHRPGMALFAGAEYLEDGETIQITSLNGAGAGTDDLLLNTSIEIIIDPA